MDHAYKDERYVVELRHPVGGKWTKNERKTIRAATYERMDNDFLLTRLGYPDRRVDGEIVEEVIDMKTGEIVYR